MRISPSLLLLLSLASSTAAQEVKPDKQPKIVVAVPLAVAIGAPVKLSLRGLFLDEITEVKFTSSEIRVEVVSKGKAAVPQNYDAKRIGDTQAEVSFTLPPETPVGTLKLMAASAN